MNTHTQTYIYIHTYKQSTEGSIDKNIQSCYYRTYNSVGKIEYLYVKR